MSEILDNIAKKLNASGIHPLRQLGRAVGVYSPTNKKKDELIADILAIAANRADPVSNDSRRGAPPKSEEYDRALLSEIERCRRFYAGLGPAEERANSPSFSAAVESPLNEDEGEVYSGILENADKYWFIRPVRGAAEVYVHSSFISRFRLRTGDKIVCKAQKKGGEDVLSASCIISVNGIAPENLSRSDFESLTACYPLERISLEHENCSLSERLIDLFAPIGKGQRALICSPHKAGCTTLLKHIAGAIVKNHPDISVIVALIDGRPEDATDFRRSVGGAHVVCSSFDRGASDHVYTARLALEHAKRLVESGRDAVLILDSITSLTRAYADLSDGGSRAQTDAIMQAKRFFGAARNTEEGGSLTIIASVLTGTGNAADVSIYEEFKAACNMEVTLSATLSAARIYPAIDIASSGTRRADLLLTPEEENAAFELRSAVGRGASVAQLFAQIASTPDNAALVASVGEIIKKTENHD